MASLQDKSNNSNHLYDDFVDDFDLPDFDFYPSQSGGERTGKRNKSPKKNTTNIYGNKHVRISMARLNR